MRKRPLPTTANKSDLSQKNLVQLAILASILKMLGLLTSCGDGYVGIFPTVTASACGTSTECMDNEHFGTAADLWCSYNESLKKQNRGPACLRIPCPIIGQVCATGGVCEKPDALATKHGLTGFCRKFVCSKPADCLPPTPVCATGFCVPEQILMFH